MRDDWFRRDRRILEIVAETEASKSPQLHLADVAKELDLTLIDVTNGVTALYEAGYFATKQRGRDGRGPILFLVHLREKGRRELGLWPASGFDALVAALEERIRQEDEPEAKSKLERLLAQIGEVGRDVITDVIAAVIKSSAGLP